MVIDELSFHDSEILEVREHFSSQIIDFLLEFPIDWKSNLFEKKILRFIDVTFYSIDEIPFAGSKTILKAENLGQVKKDIGNEYRPWIVIRNKIELQTNAGIRIVECTDCELLNPE